MICLLDLTLRCGLLHSQHSVKVAATKELVASLQERHGGLKVFKMLQRGQWFYHKHSTLNVANWASVQSHLENNSKNIILNPIRSIEQHKHVSKFWVGCTAVCLLMGPAADCLFERVRALTCRKRNTAAAPRTRTSRARQNMWSAAKQRTVRLVLTATC